MVENTKNVAVISSVTDCQNLSFDLKETNVDRVDKRVIGLTLS